MRVENVLSKLDKFYSMVEWEDETCGRRAVYVKNDLCCFVSRMHFFAAIVELVDWLVLSSFSANKNVCMRIIWTCSCSLRIFWQTNNFNLFFFLNTFLTLSQHEMKNHDARYSENSLNQIRDDLQARSIYAFLENLIGFFSSIFINFKISKFLLHPMYM